ncbi:FMN-dependent NADH-azoreductase [Thalassococcus sp. S3]|uniref:FMN-dependent NADH-azoreductase n=1 Tax=Thalassococcus sp. S3 TaxID=2017482 RepID=UPI0010242997|nr:NAD(P)H-dependent oxidoreductase [Thalassococcus sp. S3]QBF32331.1 FMN-dependent NADH-azoreductase [Thalassococcus sp. S3]
MKILHINASPRGDESQSLDIANTFLFELQKDKAVQIDQLDLFAADLPPFGTVATSAKMALFTGRDQTEEEVAAWAAVRAVFDRFANADLYVLNVPIWNNGIPYILKQFIDLVTQPGWSFGFDPEAGYSGLMTGRKAVLVHASGVWHQDIGPNFGSDFSTPFLEDWLTFIGIEDVQHLRVQPTVLNANYAATKAEAKRQSTALASAY